jgi:hypothetical protein
MTDTTAAALRMALVMFSQDQDAHTQAWISNQLKHRPDISPYCRDVIGTRLLAWAETRDARLGAVVRSLLDGTPTHAPGMGGLDVLSHFPGQEARAQAKAFNKKE